MFVHFRTGYRNCQRPNYPQVEKLNDGCYTLGAVTLVQYLLSNMYSWNRDNLAIFCLFTLGPTIDLVMVEGKWMLFIFNSFTKHKSLFDQPLKFAIYSAISMDWIVVSSMWKRLILWRKSICECDALYWKVNQT